MTESTDSRPAPARYYTPSEARALLPEVRGVVAELREVLDRGRAWASRAQGSGGGVEPGTLKKELEGARAHVERLHGRLAAWSIDLKGLDPILLDFPGLRHGAPVCLCWREGEDDLEHWHTEQMGFRGRRPLADTPDGAWEWCN